MGDANADFEAMVDRLFERVWPQIRDGLFNLTVDARRDLILKVPGKRIEDRPQNQRH